jgi:hypothetical protein
MFGKHEQRVHRHDGTFYWNSQSGGKAIAAEHLAPPYLQRSISHYDFNVETTSRLRYHYSCVLP